MVLCQKMAFGGGGAVFGRGDGDGGGGDLRDAGPLLFWWRQRAALLRFSERVAGATLCLIPLQLKSFLRLLPIWLPCFLIARWHARENSLQNSAPIV